MRLWNSGSSSSSTRLFSGSGLEKPVSPVTFGQLGQKLPDVALCCRCGDEGVQALALSAALLAWCVWSSHLQLTCEKVEWCCGTHETCGWTMSRLGLAWDISLVWNLKLFSSFCWTKLILPEKHSIYLFLWSWEQFRTLCSADFRKVVSLFHFLRLPG